jgi:hypothetical protein
MAYPERQRDAHGIVPARDTGDGTLQANPMRYRSLLAAALAVLVLAGCGSSSSDQPSGPRSWTLPQLLRLSGLRRSSDGLTYTLPNQPRCVARIVLRSTAEVQTYKNAGDVVATNPDKSAGVRVEPGSPATCKAVFTQALAHVK